MVRDSGLPEECCRAARLSARIRRRTSPRSDSISSGAPDGPPGWMQRGKLALRPASGRRTDAAPGVEPGGLLPAAGAFLAAAIPILAARLPQHSMHIRAAFLAGGGQPLVGAAFRVFCMSEGGLLAASAAALPAGGFGATLEWLASSRLPYHCHVGYLKVGFECAVPKVHRA